MDLICFGSSNRRESAIFVGTGGRSFSGSGRINFHGFGSREWCSLFSRDEYEARRNKLCEEMGAAGIDLAAVFHPVDLLYLAGTCRASYLWLTREGDAWLAARRGAFEARKESFLPVEEFGNGSQLAAVVYSHYPRKAVCIGTAFDGASHESVIRLQKLFPAAEIADLGPALRGIRQVKSPAELDLIRLAGKQLDGAFKTAASLLRLGQSELDLAVRVEAYLRRKGHPGQLRAKRAVSGASFGFVLTGRSSLAAPEADMICTGPGLTPAMPFGPGDLEFTAGEPVLFDYCGCCAGYLADMSRMLSIGRPAEEASWAYEAMRQVLRKIEAKLGPGQETGRLYELARKQAMRLGYEEQFMGVHGRQLSFVGHGVGLELDEPPYLAKGRRDILAPGMVLAIEPKVVLGGLGVVGVENTYVITEDGWECLTPTLEEWRQVPVD